MHMNVPIAKGFHIHKFSNYCIKLGALVALSDFHRPDFHCAKTLFAIKLHKVRIIHSTHTNLTVLYTIGDCTVKATELYKNYKLTCFIVIP